MSIGRVKTVVFGAGNVGSAVAYGLALERLCGEIVLIDKNADKAWAEAEDLKHALAVVGSGIKVKSGGYDECSDADIVVLTAAPPYKLGQTRPEMLGQAAEITASVVPNIMASGFKGFFIVVTNPVDVITAYVQQLSGLPPERVIGTGTALDSARLRMYIAERLHVDPMSIAAFCMGEHGESQIIPWSLASVGSKPLTEVIADNPDRLGDFDFSKAAEEIRKVAYDIVTRKGSTTFGISMSACSIAEAIISGKRTVIPVSARLNGEYGVSGIYAGVPAVIGMNGIKELAEYRLKPDELEAFRRSAEIIRGYCAELGIKGSV